MYTSRLPGYAILQQHCRHLANVVLDENVPLIGTFFTSFVRAQNSIFRRLFSNLFLLLPDSVVVKVEVNLIHVLFRDCHFEFQLSASGTFNINSEVSDTFCCTCNQSEMGVKSIQLFDSFKHMKQLRLIAHHESVFKALHNCSSNYRKIVLLQCVSFLCNSFLLQEALHRKLKYISLSA